MKTSFKVSFNDGSTIQVLADNAMDAIRKAQKTLINGNNLVCVDIQYKRPEQWVKIIEEK